MLDSKTVFLARLVAAFLLLPIGHATARASDTKSEVPQPESPGATAENRNASAARPGEVIKHVMPIYPEAFRSARVKARVTLKTLVDEKGEVTVVEVRRSSGRPEFDKAAIDAVRQWRYKPFLKDGQPVKTDLTLVVKFEPN